MQWPKYTLEEPQNLMFDVNATDVVYVEPDYYRAEGIQYLQDHFISAYGR